MAVVKPDRPFLAASVHCGGRVHVARVVLPSGLQEYRSAAITATAMIYSSAGSVCRRRMSDKSWPSPPDLGTPAGGGAPGDDATPVESMGDAHERGNRRGERK